MITLTSYNLGGAVNVLLAIQKYESMKQLDAELEGKKSEVKRVEKEIADNNLQLNAVKYTLRETDGIYKEDLDVKNVVALIRDPRGLGLDSETLVSLLILVLQKAKERINNGVDPTQAQNPTLTITMGEMDALVDNLRRLIKQKKNA